MTRKPTRQLKRGVTDGASRAHRTMAANSHSKAEVDNWNDLSHVSSKVLVPGVTGKQVIDYYNQWATQGYEKALREDTHNHHYGALKVMQRVMEDLFPSGRDSAVVLDVGAGTGLCGQMLRDAGFKVVDGLDPAANMLHMAKDKQVYRHTFVCYLTGQPTPDIPSDSYDCVTMTGVVCHGTLPCAAFEEITRMVKPGGYIINCMRAAFLKEVDDYARHWESLRARMEKEGRWKVLRMDSYPNHYMGHEGLLMVIQVLQ